jgi:hypothetical protein
VKCGARTIGKRNPPVNKKATRKEDPIAGSLPIALPGWQQKKLAFLFRFGYMAYEREFYGPADPEIEPLVVAELT